MQLSDILKRKDEIISIADKFGLSNIRLTKNISRNLNLVIDEDESRTDLPRWRSALFSEYLSNILHCPIEIFEGHCMDPHTVSLEQPLDDIRAGIKDLFGREAEHVEIQKKKIPYGFFPVTIQTIKNIIGEDAFRTDDSVETEPVPTTSIAESTMWTVDEFFSMYNKNNDPDVGKKRKLDENSSSTEEERSELKKSKNTQG